MKKNTLPKTSYNNIDIQTECGCLSENELKVLKYMKDQEPHSTPPKGMGDDVFCVVCEMLVDRKYIKELKNTDPVMSWGESPRYHIMPKGYEVITLLEQEEKRKEEEAQQKIIEEEKKLDSIITDEELSMLYAEVVSKHPYFLNSRWSDKYWDETKEYLRKLFCQRQSPMFVYTIANELDVKNTYSRVFQNYGSVDDGDRIAYKLYIVIYYKYKGDPTYATMLDALAPKMGHLGSHGRLEEIHKRLDAVRAKYGAEKKSGSNESEEVLIRKLADVENQLARANEERARLQGLTADANEEVLSDEDLPTAVLKLRIELLNLLLGKAGFDIKRIQDGRLGSTIIELYHLILNEGAVSLLRANIGKVVYKKKPKEVDEKVKEINELLAKLDKEWSMQL